MRNSKHGLQTLGLMVFAVLGLALFAASASAQTHEEKLHKEVLEAGTPLPLASPAGTFTINLGAALLATATGAQEGSGKLLVAGRNLDLECTSADVLEGKLNSSTEGLAKVAFLGCVALEHNTKNPLTGCNIPNQEVSAQAKLKPILHGGNNYVLAEPEVVGGNFAVVTFKEKEGCVLPLSNPVKGSVVAQVTNGLESVVPLITFSQAIQELSGDKLLFGTFPAFVNASANIELTGTHLGQKIGVH